MASAEILDTIRPSYVWNGTNWIPLGDGGSTGDIENWGELLDRGWAWIVDNAGSVHENYGYITNLAANNKYLTIINASATYIPKINQQSIINSASAAAVTYLIDSAPSALDTLNEIAAAINDDASFYTTISNVYLTQSSASSTYLTQSSASSTYLTQSSASSTYLTQSSASTQYGKSIPYSSSTPISPVTGDLWVDSTLTPPSLKVYDGSSWVQLGSAAAVDDSQAIIASRMFG